jgi:chitinase
MIYGYLRIFTNIYEYLPPQLYGKGDGGRWGDGNEKKEDNTDK